MKRRDFIAAAASSAFVAASTAGCSLKSTLPDSRSLVDTSEKRKAYLEKMLKALVTDLGPRWVGTPAMDRATEIVRNELALAMPVVQEDPITFDRWELVGEPEFSVGGKKLEIYPSHGTGGTPPEGITGILKKSETPQVAYDVVDRAGGAILGRVVITPKEKATPRPYWFYDKETGGMPNVCVGKQDVPLLDAALADKTPVLMQYQVKFTPGKITTNVIGTLPGESAGEIVLYAHLDSVYNSPGANDNAASLIMVLMLAHAFSGKRPKKTLTFTSTTGEEYGYLGSKRLAEQRKQAGTLNNIRFIFDFDSITWGNDMTLITEDEELASMLTDIDRTLNLPGTPQWRKGDGLGRETLPLKEAGLQARGIVVDSVPDNEINVLCWHRPDDKADYIRFEPVDIAFRLFGELVNRLQTIPG